MLNVGTGRQTDLLEILRVVEQQSGRTLERRMEPAREGDIRHSRADAGRARWVLGWEAGTPLSAGLAETWAWFTGATGRRRRGRSWSAAEDAWLAGVASRSAPCPSAAARRWPSSP